MQNNDLIGKIVLSKCGRDKDHYYVIVDKVDDDYYLLSNGSNKTIQMPKKKKIKHRKNVPIFGTFFIFQIVLDCTPTG